MEQATIRYSTPWTLTQERLVMINVTMLFTTGLTLTGTFADQAAAESASRELDLGPASLTTITFCEGAHCEAKDGFTSAHYA